MFSLGLVALLMSVMAATRVAVMVVAVVVASLMTMDAMADVQQ